MIAITYQESTIILFLVMYHQIVVAFNHVLYSSSIMMMMSHSSLLFHLNGENSCSIFVYLDFLIFLSGLFFTGEGRLKYFSHAFAV